MKITVKHVGRYRVQMQLFIICIFNLTLKVLPTHFLRVEFLKLFKSRIGYGTAVHCGVYFTRPGKFYVGQYCTINKNCFIDTRGSVRIGDYVMIGQQSKIYTAGHSVDSELFDGFISGVQIGDYAVIFPDSLIMPGVNIGKGAVVLTGSVVTKDVDEYAVVGGNPCEFIRYRSAILKYKHNYKFWLPNV